MYRLILVIFLFQSCVSPKKKKPAHLISDSVIRAGLKNHISKFDTINFPEGQYLSALVNDDCILLRKEVEFLKESEAMYDTLILDRLRNILFVENKIKDSPNEIYQLNINGILIHKNTRITIEKNAKNNEVIFRIHQIYWGRNEEGYFDVLNTFVDSEKHLTTREWNKFNELLGETFFWRIIDSTEDTGILDGQDWTLYASAYHQNKKVYQKVSTKNPRGSLLAVFNYLIGLHDEDLSL